jgi:hypothetical protein
VMRMFPPLSEHFSTRAVMFTILVNHMVYGIIVAVVYVS